MTAAEVWAVIYPWIVSGLGGLIGAALLLPTKLGEALFQFRMHKLLEEFKAQQSRELERLKADQSQGLERLREQLNHLGDRGRRSNEMEFVAIESVWKAFVRAWLSTNTYISAMITVPRFSTMSNEEFESFLSSSDLTPGEREMLTNASDKEKEYSKVLNWRTIVEAGTDIYQARLTLREKRIFMPANLTSEFSELIERMSAAQVERRLSLQNPHIPAYDFGKSTTDWMRDCVSVFDQMAALANQRLFRAEHMEQNREAS